MSETLDDDRENCTDSVVNNVFIAVHAGAGNHSKSSEHVYKAVCKMACQQAMTLLQTRKSALEAVTAAVVALEDDACTNAGKGSNLTMQGTVECDASAMDGNSLLFGAVGALSGVVNPVVVASRLVEEQKLGPLSFGRIRPSILVGKGAQAFCAERDIGINDNLISESAFKTYNRYKRKCQNADVEASSQKKQKLEAPETSITPDNLQSQANGLFQANGDWVQDTVGAVCMDYEGNVAAATSSGGIWLKHSGRLGPTAIYGAGCWAQNQRSISDAKLGIAAVTSGCGEHLIPTVLAKTCCDAVRCSSDCSSALANSFKKDFLESQFLASTPEKYGAVLMLKTSQAGTSKEAEIFWIHSTASMCLAYMAGNKKAPMVTMSRLEDPAAPGQSYTMSSKVVVL